MKRYNGNIHSYNEPWLYLTNLAGPQDFVANKYDYKSVSGFKFFKDFEIGFLFFISQI